MEINTGRDTLCALRAARARAFRRIESFVMSCLEFFAFSKNSIRLC